MGTTRLVLRTDKPLRNGKCPLDLIYQVSGQRKYFRTDKKLYPASWDAEKQKPIYLNKQDAKKLTFVINLIFQQIILKWLKEAIVDFIKSNFLAGGFTVSL